MSSRGRTHKPFKRREAKQKPPPFVPITPLDDVIAAFMRNGAGYHNFSTRGYRRFRVRAFAREAAKQR